MAIFEGEDIFEIDAERCTECVGHFEQPQCQIVCPVDCIPLDPQHQENDAMLQQKYKQLTGKKL